MQILIPYFLATGALIGIVLVFLLETYPNARFTKIVFNIWPFLMVGLGVCSVNHFYGFFTFINLGHEVINGILRIIFGFLAIVLTPAIILIAYVQILSNVGSNCAEREKQYKKFFNRKDN